MNTTDIHAALAAIRDAAKAGDSEAAHCLEDRLYLTVLEAISRGDCASPPVLARLALSSRQISFGRWCS